MGTAATAAYITQKHFSFQFLNQTCLSQNQDHGKEGKQNVKDCAGVNVCYLCLTDLTLRSYKSRYVAVRLLCDLTVPVAGLETHNIKSAISLDDARWNLKHQPLGD